MVGQRTMVPSGRSRRNRQAEAADDMENLGLTREPGSESTSPGLYGAKSASREALAQDRF